MTIPGSLGDRIEKLCIEAAEDMPDEVTRERLLAIRTRLHEPLRVAIAGRVKAGKSTLLNALVGERLAPTDAGECTRVVSWYRHDSGYQVRALVKGGGVRAVPFTRSEGQLHLQVSDSEIDRIERLEIGWPSSRLASLTLIDTPGIGSTDDIAGERAAAFFALDEDRPPDADAVVYLMRHAHRTDAEFLDSFLDRSVTNASPVNAVGVLSRADEVGAGRLDALDSARRIATRYHSDTRLAPLISNVIAVAGLLAETAATLEEREAGLLRQLSREPAEVIDEMLLSADRFLEPSTSGLTAELRRELLGRLGMFGVRYSIALLQQGEVSSATELSRALLAVSGVNELRDLIEGQFASRAHLLQARSALGSLNALASELANTGAAFAHNLRGRIEALEASAHELAEFRLLHMLRSGDLQFTPDEAHEAELLAASGTAPERLGLASGTSKEQVQSAALEAVARWRARAENPLTDRSTSYGANVMARSYEGIYASLS